MTLEWLANEMQAKHGLVVHVDAFGQVKVESDGLKTFLYKAAQELLFNVVKHARVNEARIRVRRLGRCICLSVSDRGRGFDPKEIRQTAGFGLLSIRERVELLGGRMRITAPRARAARSTSWCRTTPDRAAGERSCRPEARRAYPTPGRTGGHGGPEGSHGAAAACGCCWRTTTRSCGRA